MKKKEWNEGLNHLDSDLVEKYVRQKDILSQKKQNPKGAWLRIVAIASCFLLAFSAAVFLPMLLGGGPVEDPGAETTDNPSDTTNDTPGGDIRSLRWDDVSDLFAIEKSSDVTNLGSSEEIAFCEIKSGKYSAYKKPQINSVISDDYVGNKVDTVTVRTGWLQLWNNKEHDVYDIDAEVYEIKGVDTQVAVAIKYLKKTVSDSIDYYYVYVNSCCEADTVQDYLKMYDAEKHMTVMSNPHLINPIVVTFDGDTVTNVKYRVKEESLDTIKSGILNLTSKETYSSYTESDLQAIEDIMDACKQRLRLSVNIKTGGDMSLYVLDNGYVCFGGINEFFALYFIGEEAAQNLFDLIVNGSELVIPPTFEGEDTLTENGGVEETTVAPAYTPGA